MICKGLASPQDERCCVHVRLLLKVIYSVLSSWLRAPGIARASSVQGARDGPGAACAGEEHGIKDGGGEGELLKCSCGREDVPLGSGWISSSTGVVLWGPLSGISLSCLAVKGSFTGKM